MAYHEPIPSHTLIFVWSQHIQRYYIVYTFSNGETTDYWATAVENGSVICSEGGESPRPSGGVHGAELRQLGSPRGETRHPLQSVIVNGIRVRKNVSRNIVILKPSSFYVHYC